MASIGALLRERAAADPDRVLLRFGDESLTLAQVDRETDRLAAGLRERGLGPGDRFVLAVGNTAEFPLLWLAAAKAGSVVVPVSPAAGSADLGHVLRDSGARLLVAEQPRAAGVPAATPAALRAAPAPAGAVAAVDGGLLSLQYTSGTTGLPKACMLSHDYWSDLAGVAQHLASVQGSDVLLTAAPFHYIDPQWHLVLALRAGATLVVLPRFSPAGFWDSVVASGATFCYLVGAMPQFLLQLPERPEAEQGHRLRLVVCSGIRPEVHEELERRYRVPWREAYGMTETGVDLAVPVEEAASVGTGWLGSPVPGKQVRVRDGELLVRGRPMMDGYWGAGRPCDEDGWFATGDLVAADRDGRLRLTGRRKDMVRRGGENVAAAEVEAVLAQHPDVVAVAVVAVPDDLRGEEVKAFVQAVPAARPDPAALVAFAADRLTPFKVPRYVEFVQELPMTPSARVAKHLLVGRPGRTFDARP